MMQIDFEGGEPTGEVVVVTLAIPAPVYRFVSAVARAKGVSTRKLLIRGFSWFLDQIEEAREIAEQGDY